VAASGDVREATFTSSRVGRTAKAELDYIGQNGRVSQVDQKLIIRGCDKQHKHRRRR
jgi:hypothetical protein